MKLYEIWRNMADMQTTPEMQMAYWNEYFAAETENYKKEDYHEKKEVPIYCKLNLTLKEAALYSNIGINKLNSLTSDPDCPFVLFIGHKKLIKRKPFEDFINNEFTQSL